MPIQRQVDQGQRPVHEPQLRLEHGLDVLQFGRERGRYLGFIVTAWAAAAAAFSGGRRGLLRRDFGAAGGFLFGSPNDLVQAQGKGAPGLSADQGQAEKREAGDEFLIETGEKAVEAMRMLAGFGDDDLIASEDIDLGGFVEMVAKEEPKHARPREGRGKEALHRAIATAGARPAGEAAHGDAPRERQDGHDNVTELPGGGGGEGWQQTGEEW
jgi:hypothetical protein